MGDGRRENPYTREDVLKLIEENDGTAAKLDLSGKVFEEGIDLRELNLMGIILNRAVFPFKVKELSSWKTTGGGAQLQGTNLIDAKLQDAELGVANLERAILRGAQLQKAHLLLANLRQANLEDAQLRDTVLDEAQLQGANLSRARLEGAHLYKAKFSSDTRLEDADWGNYILGEEKDSLFDWAVAAYRQLKVWHNNAGYSDTAAKFYYREKEAARKGAKRRRDRAVGWLSWAVFGHGEG